MALPATVTTKLEFDTNVFTDDVSEVILQAQTWQKMIAGIGSMPSSKETSPADDGAGTLEHGAVFLLVGSMARCLGALLDTVTLLQIGTEDPVLPGVKLMADMTVVLMSLGNAGLVEMVRPTTTPRQELDWAFVAMLILPLFIGMWRYACLSLLEPVGETTSRALAAVESLTGAVLLISVTSSYILEYQEDPPQGTTNEQFQQATWSKYMQNASASIYAVLACEALLVPGSPQQKAVRTARIAAAAIESGYAVELAVEGIKNSYSDIL